MNATTQLASPPVQSEVHTADRRLRGKRVAMVTFSAYPADPRPRRAVDVLLRQGMSVDLICLADEKTPKRETSGELRVRRLSIAHRRGGKLAYFYEYFAFIFATAAILALRTLKQRYDLVYIHNMPDVLVISALAPKLFGAEVILDLHDPMPELMRAIYNLPKDSFSVRLMQWLEKWSIARADRVVTVNIACKRIFASRSCGSEKVGVVMNTPDEEIFPFRAPQTRSSASDGAAQPFVIMYHGSMVERNGLDLAVEALALVRKTVPSAELRIYGSKTAFLDKVMETARSKGLGDCVHYLGPKRLEDLVHAIADCDVGVIRNHRNEFTEINTPTRIFEYLATGKPVVAPRTPGVEDYFGPESLFFFEAGDARELAQQIEYVYLHPREAARTTEQGQQVYLTHRWSQERQALTKLVASLF